MISLSIPHRSHLTRQVRRIAFIALHTVEHHYFSLVSAAILAAVLALALTSASFDAKLGPEPEQAQTNPYPGFLPWATATPGVVAHREEALPESRLLVYYVFESEMQADEIAIALDADVTFHPIRGFSNTPAHGYLIVENAGDEAAAIEYLKAMAVTPPNGRDLRVVDLR